MTADLVARLEAAAENWPTVYGSDRANIALLREAASALRSSGEAKPVAYIEITENPPGSEFDGEVDVWLLPPGINPPAGTQPLYLHPATPASAWRPIAEAPRDESLLLLGWNNGNPAHGAHIVIGSNWHGLWVDRGMDEPNRDLGNTLVYVEYFQALPAPPTSTKGG